MNVHKNLQSMYHGPRPEQYRQAVDSAATVTSAQAHSPVSVFNAVLVVYVDLIEHRTAPDPDALKALTLALDALETRGYLSASEHPKTYQAYRQLAEFTRTHVQAELLRSQPHPPAWAPEFPDPMTLNKTVYQLMDYAIVLMAEVHDCGQPLPHRHH